MTQMIQSPAAPGHAPPEDELPAQPVTQAIPPRQLHTSANTCQVVAVGGGKGGIGKSLVSANMAVSLAQSGKQVVLLDADLGGANLHTYLGMQPPKRTLSEFVSRQAEHLDELITPTNVPNLGLISGALDALGAANLKYNEKVRLLREILRLKVDVVVVDLGGRHGGARDRFISLGALRHPHGGPRAHVHGKTPTDSSSRPACAACARWPPLGRYRRRYSSF